ncbi:MAG: single-stranded DNA-binding protein [Anaerolineales bacterium]|jgi:single-strand DNA-binding protein
MYQKIIIIGNLGGDPEMRYTPSGQAVTNFNVATSRRYTTSDGNQVDETTWFRISTWGKTAEVCNQYLKKGRRVLVEGRLNPDKDTGGPRVYTRQDGTSGASYEITGEVVRFLTPRSESEGGYSADDSPGLAEPEDIPF